MEPVSILSLTSLAAVIAAAIALTYVVKRALATVPIASRVPVWVYTSVIAGVLTYIANRITGTLEGATGVLIIDAIINGALASGIREWATTVNKPLAASSTAREVIAEQGGAGRSTLRVVLPWLLIGSTAMGASFCASSPKELILEVQTGIQLGIEAVDDAELLAYTSQKFPGLTPEVHADISDRLALAYRKQAQLARAMTTWQPGEALPATFAEVAAELRAIDTLVRQFAPAAADLLQAVASALQLIDDLQRQLRGGEAHAASTASAGRRDQRVVEFHPVGHRGWRLDGRPDQGADRARPLRLVA